MKRLLASIALITLVTLCLPAVGPRRAALLEAQRIALQSVSATLASNVTCTGTEQDFRTNQGIAGFNNIGQTSHLATATSDAASFTMEIDGIDNAGNVFRLSDLQVGAPTNAKGGLVVTAAGYMTNIQVAVTCSAGATFTLSYSGSFSPSPPDVGGALLTAIDKLPFQSAAAGSGSSTTFQSPTGNSSGTIIFQYAAAGPAGSTIDVQCLSNAGTDLNFYSFAPGTGTGPQLFPVVSSTCPFVDLTYVSGGASATTYNLEYVFNTVQTTSSTTPTNVSVTNSPLSVDFPSAQPVTCTSCTFTPPATDPCQTSGVLKTSAPINITAAGATQIVALSAGKTIYPCSFAIDANVSSSSVESFQWEYGTGAACGTGTTALSGAMQSGASTGTGPIPISLSGPGTIMTLPASNALCLNVVQVSGTVIGVQGLLSYVQQ